MALMNKLTDKELIEELRIRMTEKTDALYELKTLNEKLRLLNKKLEDSEAMKSHFISNITNEIVNPFSSILGLSKNILSVNKENWKKVFSMVAMIHTEAFSLDFQLKNIFAAAKIEAGEIYPEIGRVDIINLVRSVTDSFRIEAQKKRVVFDITFELPSTDGPVYYFKTDPEKLKLILSNLVNNALKYCFSNSKINVIVWCENKVMFISVLNQGDGISEDYQQLIFDRFKRIDSSITSVNRGHGLGLSIVKSLLDLLGGNISLQSDNESGTTFVIGLPESDDEEDSFISSLNGNEIFFEDNQVF
jgi:signal transduction histidine kinase